MCGCVCVCERVHNPSSSSAAPPPIGYFRKYCYIIVAISPDSGETEPFVSLSSANVKLWTSAVVHKTAVPRRVGTNRAQWITIIIVHRYLILWQRDPNDRITYYDNTSRWLTMFDRCTKINEKKKKQLPSHCSLMMTIRFSCGRSACSRKNGTCNTEIQLLQ